MESEECITKCLKKRYQPAPTDGKDVKRVEFEHISKCMIAQFPAKIIGSNSATIPSWKLSAQRFQIRSKDITGHHTSLG